MGLSLVLVEHLHRKPTFDVRRKKHEGIEFALSIQDVLWKACSLHLLPTLIRSTLPCYDPKLSQKSLAKGSSDPFGLLRSPEAGLHQ